MDSVQKKEFFYGFLKATSHKKPRIMSECYDFLKVRKKTTLLRKMLLTLLWHFSHYLVIGCNGNNILEVLISYCLFQPVKKTYPWMLDGMIRYLHVNMDQPIKNEEEKKNKAISDKLFDLNLKVQLCDSVIV